MSLKQPEPPEKLKPTEIAAYLDRIGYRGPVEVSPETLRGLHVAHMLSVPFENLDIVTGQYIRLELRPLYDKIVNRRRGGFCYELNGLFAALLRGLGFAVTLQAAGVANGSGGFSDDFDHLTLLVQLENRWLADVGFGDSFLGPIRFDGSEEGTQDETGRYRIQRVAEACQLQKLSEEVWQPQYRFDLTPHVLGDFVDRCHFQQTSPDSHFTQGRICSLARPGGRISLSKTRLITTVDQVRQQREITGEDEVKIVLRDVFGVVMDPPAQPAAGRAL